MERRETSLRVKYLGLMVLGALFLAGCMTNEQQQACGDIQAGRSVSQDYLYQCLLALGNTPEKLTEYRQNYQRQISAVVSANCTIPGAAYDGRRHYVASRSLGVDCEVRGEHLPPAVIGLNGLTIELAGETKATPEEPLLRRYTISGQLAERGAQALKLSFYNGRDRFCADSTLENFHLLPTQCVTLKDPLLTEPINLDYEVVFDDTAPDISGEGIGMQNGLVSAAFTAQDPQSGLAWATVNGQPATVGDGGRVEIQERVREGENRYVLEACNPLNMCERAELVVSDSTPPVLNIESAVMQDGLIRIILGALDPESAIEYAAVGQTVFTPDGDGRVEALLPVSEGENNVQIVVKNRGGLSAEANITLRDETPAAIGGLESKVEQGLFAMDFLAVDRESGIREVVCREIRQSGETDEWPAEFAGDNRFGCRRPVGQGSVRLEASVRNNVGLETAIGEGFVYDLLKQVGEVNQEFNNKELVMVMGYTSNLDPGKTRAGFSQDTVYSLRKAGECTVQDYATGEGGFLVIGCQTNDKGKGTVSITITDKAGNSVTLGDIAIAVPEIAGLEKTAFWIAAVTGLLTATALVTKGISLHRKHRDKKMRDEIRGYIRRGDTEAINKHPYRDRYLAEARDMEYLLLAKEKARVRDIAQAAGMVERFMDRHRKSEAAAEVVFHLEEAQELLVEAVYERISALMGSGTLITDEGLQTFLKTMRTYDWLWTRLRKRVSGERLNAVTWLTVVEAASDNSLFRKGKAERIFGCKGQRLAQTVGILCSVGDYCAAETSLRYLSKVESVGKAEEVYRSGLAEWMGKLREVVSHGNGAIRELEEMGKRYRLTDEARRLLEKEKTRLKQSATVAELLEAFHNYIQADVDDFSVWEKKADACGLSPAKKISRREAEAARAVARALQPGVWRPVQIPYFLGFTEADKNLPFEDFYSELKFRLQRLATSLDHHRSCLQSQEGLDRDIRMEVVLDNTHSEVIRWVGTIKKKKNWQVIHEKWRQNGVGDTTPPLIRLNGREVKLAFI